MKRNNSTNRIAVMTTLAPNNIENQRKAISSWQTIGFKVLSFNCSEEIQYLKPYFNDIDFIEAKRNAREEYGKPYVYFTDIMEFFRNSSYEICGIINSDIYFHGVDDRFINFIIDEVRDSLVFGQRIDVDSFDDLSGKMYIGFDYFFFEKRLAGIYPDEKFCIGQPVWDYWIIFIAAINNIKTKRIVNHIAYHEKHNQKWNEDIKNMLTDIILNKYMGFLQKNDLSREELYREYVKYVFNKHDDIYYDAGDREPSIMIIYNDCGIDDINKSATYQSIMNQNYSNVKLMMGTTNTVDFSNISTDAVCFVDEGYILNKHFLKMMSRNILQVDFVYCGIKATYLDTYISGYIYPDYMDDSSVYYGIIQSCILYNTKFIKKSGLFKGHNFMKHKAELVGQCMVELLNYRVQVQYMEREYDNIIKQYKDYHIPEIQYYVALSYRQKGELLKSEEYFEEMLNEFDKLSCEAFFIKLQYLPDDITDILMEKAYKLKPDSWRRLYNYCIKRADLRYKLLNNLYRNNEYDKIMEFSNEDSPEVCFYMGRACKDTGMYIKAIEYLKKYLDSAKTDIEHARAPIMGNNFILSAYYHLGELYYLIDNMDKAKSFFEICISVSEGFHAKAYEYLSKIKEQ